MCGIAGEVNFSDHFHADEQTFLQMKKLLKRRGPDQDDICRYENCTLVHDRLAVIDLRHGRQPMAEKRGEQEFCIVYNGELYNTDELRSRLAGRGYHFHGRSDTEVLLKCYMEWGEQCLPMLNGIYAFAVWENHNKKLFIARDRMGVKPFFYAQVNGVFIFASEIKALLVHPLVGSRIDAGSIAEIMLIGPGRTPGNGVFKDVKELCAGHCGSFSRDGLVVRKYWELYDNPHTETFEQTMEKVRYLVTDSIERQLVSDVPICTFLSGGLDSSIISAVAARHLKRRGERLTTFSVDYRDNVRYFKHSRFQPNQDSDYIGLMVTHLDSEHHNIVIDTEELVEALFPAVEARDLPGMADVDASLLLFCSRVKEKCSVAISGECADEIFGGYPWYRDKTIRDAIGFPWSQSTAYRCSFLREEILDGLSPWDYVQERYMKTVRVTNKIPGLSDLESRMKEMNRLNLDWFMQTLLDRKDRMSMYSGLEVRVPFCDHRIVEYLYTVPWELKDWQNREKGLLREAFKDLLPEEIVWRKKSPYPKTHHPNYLKRVSGLLQEVVANPSSPILSIVRKNALECLLQMDNAVPWYGQLMTTPQTIAYFLQLNHWLEKYHVTFM
jgi:asparagine synthase (glutamine-hydrolysing)